MKVILPEFDQNIAIRCFFLRQGLGLSLLPSKSRVTLSSHRVATSSGVVYFLATRGRVASKETLKDWVLRGTALKIGTHSRSDVQTTFMRGTKKVAHRVLSSNPSRQPLNLADIDLTRTDPIIRPIQPATTHYQHCFLIVLYQ